MGGRVMLTLDARRADNAVLRHAIGVALIACAFAALLSSELSVGNGRAVLESDHAVIRHGGDALLVRAHFANLAVEESFWLRPPCGDGRYRFIDKLDDGRWAIWVLERIGAHEWREITAFVTRDDSYIRRVLDRCYSKDGVAYAH